MAAQDQERGNNPFAVTDPKREAVKGELFKRQIHRADLTAIKQIGAGQFGDVYLAHQSVRTPHGVRPVPRAVKLLRGAASPEDKQVAQGSRLDPFPDVLVASSPRPTRARLPCPAARLASTARSFCTRPRSCWSYNTPTSFKLSASGDAPVQRALARAFRAPSLCSFFPAPSRRGTPPGVALQQKPWLCVLEFMKYGDLRTVLIDCAEKNVTLSLYEQLVCRAMGLTKEGVPRGV